jgi:uncharacterized protein
MLPLETAGSIANLSGLQDGRYQLAISQMDSANAAFRGGPSSVFKDKPFTNLRLVLTLYPEVIHLLVRSESQIKRVSDLIGRRVVLGESGSGTEQHALQVLKAYQLSEGQLSDGKGLRAAPLDAARLLERDEADAMFFTTAIGNSTIAHLTRVTDVQLLSIDPARMRVEDVAFEPINIPADQYKGTHTEIQTVKVSAALVTTLDLPESTVYRLLQAALSNTEGFRGIHPMLTKYFDLRESLQNQRQVNSLPLHLGSERYLREAGLW